MIKKFCPYCDPFPSKGKNKAKVCPSCKSKIDKIAELVDELNGSLPENKIVEMELEVYEV